MDAETLTVLVLFATVVLRLALVGLVIWILIPRRVTCPWCRARTDPVITGAVMRILGVQRRFCVHCGWSGWAKPAGKLGLGGAGR